MNDLLLRITHRQGILLLVALTALISTVVYWDYLTFTKLFLYKDIGSDTLNVYYPKYVHLADYLRTEGWPGWSFGQGMGQNIFPHSIGNPFELILLLLGKEQLAYGLVYIELLKIFLAGTLFFLYLRIFSIAPLIAVLGGLMYAFSGFMILGGTWYVFSVDAVYFAFLLYATERYLDDRSWSYFTICIALIAANTSFNLYLYTLFLIPYLVFRIYDRNELHLRKLLSLFGDIFVFGLLGVCISAIFVVANVHEMINSPRLLGEASFFDRLMAQSLFETGNINHNVTAILRFFSSDLIGTGSQFGGWYNYLEAPMFYCGLLALLLAPQIFIRQRWKTKLAYALFAIVFILPVIFPFLRHMFWAFSGDYYRLFSTFVSFVALFFSLHALSLIHQRKRVNIRLLILTLAVLLGLLAIPYLFGSPAARNIINGKLTILAVLFLISYAVLVLLLAKRAHKGYALLALLLVTTIELTLFSSQTVNDRSALESSEYNGRAGYNDYSIEAINKIKQKDPGFYRIEKTFNSGPAIHSSLNDAKVQGYFGTKSYHSFNQLNYIRFLDAIEVIDSRNEAETRWAKGLINDPLLLSFASVKYILTKNPDHLKLFSGFGFQGIEKLGDVYIMMNTLVLPIGFTYDSYINESDFLLLTKADKNVTLLNAAVLDDPDQMEKSRLSTYRLEDIPADYDVQLYVKDIMKRRTSALKISEFGNNRIKGTIDLASPRFLFLSIPFDEGWKISINSRPSTLKQANIGFSGIMLEAGQHEIELIYELPYFKASAAVSVASLLIFAICAWRSRLRAT